jgi:hypothetical protein
MALENATFQRGAAVYPLASPGTNSFLQDADPSLFWVTAFYAAVIETYLGPRILAEAAASGAPITDAVAYTIPDDPTDYLTEEQIKFPLLAVYRVREMLNNRTVAWRHDTAEWKVAYVLPPLTAGQRERLHPALNAVKAVLDDRTELTFDPAYLGGVSPLGAAYANLESIYVTAAEYVSWEAGGDLVFPALLLTLEVKERQMQPPTAYAALTGTDTSVDTPDPIAVATFPTTTT